MAKVSPLVLIPPLLFVALAGLFFAGMQREDPDLLPSAREGQPVPPLTMEALGSLPPFDPAVLSGPGVKVVNFWASWCAPCRAEHPNLTALSEQGVPVYGINYKDDPAKALAFLEELGNPFTGIGTDPSGRNAIDWGVYAMPETVIVDGNGVIVHHFRGPITQRSMDSTIWPAIRAAGSS